MLSNRRCGGGRYDKLIEQLGGPEMPAVGFGMGVERLIMILEKEGIERILVDMPQRNYPAGKINCQTNVFLLKDKNKLDKLLV